MRNAYRPRPQDRAPGEGPTGHPKGEVEAVPGGLLLHSDGQGLWDRGSGFGPERHPPRPNAAHKYAFAPASVIFSCTGPIKKDLAPTTLPLDPTNSPPRITPHLLADQGLACF